MLIAKRVALALVSPLFAALLFATAFDVGFVRTATHPATVKKFVADSGVYSSAVTNVLNQTKSISTDFGDIPTSDPIVQQAARVALPPQYIKEQTELAIDNIYGWLDGKTAQPSFNIDLSGAKTLFANNIADSAQKRLNALPKCTPAQSLAILQQVNFDAYNAACLPRGISPAAVAQQLQKAVAGNQDFLKNISISSASIKDSNGQPVFTTKLAGAPKQYQRAKKTPWILSILTFLAGVAVVFLSRTRLAGLRHVGIVLLVAGLVMLLFSWGLNHIISTQVVPKIKVNNAIFQQDVRTLVTDISQRIDRNYWFFGGLYAALGAAVLGGYWYLRRRAAKIKPTGYSRSRATQAPRL
jgi:hypothetical protein